VTLSCKYSNPKGKVHWFKNQMEIFHGHKYNFENDNGTFRLVIFRVCLEDTGLYICQTDDKSTSAELTVEGYTNHLTFLFIACSLVIIVYAVVNLVLVVL